MSPILKKTILLGTSMALSVGALAAQPSPGDLVPPPASSRPAPDAEIIARPPPSVDSKLARPVPPREDPGLVERPPANDLPSDRNKLIEAPSSLSSHRKDCKTAASAEVCGQDPER